MLEVRGGNATDTLFFGSQGVQGFTFFEITDARIVDFYDENSTFKFPFDGVLGLSPAQHLSNASDSLPSGSKPLLQALKEQGLISNATLSVSMSADSSSLTFGGYKESDLKNSTNAIRWFPAVGDSWQVEINNILYSTVSIDDGQHNFAFFDSFYGGIHIPLEEFLLLARQLQRTHNEIFCNTKADNSRCWFDGMCSAYRDTYANISFLINGNQAFVISPAVYLKDYKNSSGQYQCQMLVVGNIIN